MSTTLVTVVGNLVADPARREIVPGRASTTMRIASTDRRWSPEEGRYVDGRTSFYNITCWDQLAENAAESLRRGERILVQGRLSVREYTDNQDRPRTSVDIDARAIGHDLTWGISRFSRFIRNGNGERSTDSWQAGPAEVDGQMVDTQGNPLADELAAELAAGAADTADTADRVDAGV